MKMLLGVIIVLIVVVLLLTIANIGKSRRQNGQERQVGRNAQMTWAGKYARQVGKNKWLLWLVVIALWILLGYKVLEHENYWRSVLTNSASSSQSMSMRQGRLSAEVVLPIIAECESGGRQFESDGLTPLQNKEGSSAIGKYQILASKHEERAKRMGLNIRTLEGNEAYAKFLYQESGTFHWEADSRSKDCWEPKLLAISRGINTPELYVARAGEPVIIEVPPGYRWDLTGEIPSTYTTDNGYRDTRGYRIQVFEVVPPATEVALNIAITKCVTRQGCAW